MILTVQDLGGNNRTNDFELYKETTGINTGKYAIKIKNTSPFVFLTNASTIESYQFTFYITDTSNNQTVLNASGSLQNNAPIITNPLFGQDVPIYNTSLGAILFCAGNNGSYSASTQQLQWSITSASTSGWETYFSINEITGEVSLIDPSLPVDTPYTLVIRLTDVYNFTTNSTGIGSLYSETSAIITYVQQEDAQTFCATWECNTFPPTLNVTYARNRTQGYFNFWRLFLPGETIDIANTNLRCTHYYTQNTIKTLTPEEGQITFIPGDFQGDFGWDLNAGEYPPGYPNTQPTYQIFVSGVIRTSSGRIINFNGSSVSGTLPQPYYSAADSCSAFYISNDNTGWKVVNTNISTPVRWTALLEDRGTIASTVLAPGEEVSSTSFGGAYTCVVSDSLSCTLGGVITLGSC